MNSGDNEFVFFGKGSQIMAQEEVLEFVRSKKQFSIGIPKETAFEENRIALVPEAVTVLVQNGHKIIVESQAGENSFFTDKDFAGAGADLVYSPAETFKADVILKVSPLSDKEVEYLRPGQVVISSLAMLMQKPGYFKSLSEKRVTAISFEFLRDQSNSFPLVRSMGEIAGTASVLIAAEYLANRKYGKGRMFGNFTGITPTEVVIIGAGTVAQNAARAALGLGAAVKVFDNSVYKIQRLEANLNTRLFSSIIQPNVLIKSLKTADVLIGALHSPMGRTPIVVTEEMVSQMKFGSVIVDVSIDQGGCIETSRITNHTNPVFQKYGVTHYCVPNIASSVPRTASYSFSNFFAPVLLEVGDSGGVENLLKKDSGLRKGVYMYSGTLTNRSIGEYFNIPYQDLNLLLAAF